MIPFLVYKISVYGTDKTQNICEWCFWLVGIQLLFCLSTIPKFSIVNIYYFCKNITKVK